MMFQITSYMAMAVKVGSKDPRKLPLTPPPSSGLYFENETQRRILELMVHEDGEVFIPYLESNLRQRASEFACDICHLRTAGLIEQNDGVRSGELMYPFVLPYSITPLGRAVMRTLEVPR